MFQDEQRGLQGTYTKCQSPEHKLRGIGIEVQQRSNPADATCLLIPGSFLIAEDVPVRHDLDKGEQTLIKLIRRHG